jgi:hypothetical protein
MKSIYSGSQQGSMGVRAPGALHGCLSMRVCSIFVRVSIFSSIASIFASKISRVAARFCSVRCDLEISHDLLDHRRALPGK